MEIIKSKVQQKVIRNKGKKYLNYYSYLPRFVSEFFDIQKGDVLQWSKNGEDKILLQKQKREKK